MICGLGLLYCYDFSKSFFYDNITNNYYNNTSRKIPNIFRIPVHSNWFVLWGCVHNFIFGHLIGHLLLKKKLWSNKKVQYIKLRLHETNKFVTGCANQNEYNNKISQTFVLKIYADLFYKEYKYYQIDLT